MDYNPDENYQLRISLLLTRMGKKRPWLSQRSGVPIGTVNGWYRGRIPRADHLLAVARALGTTVEYLMEGSDRADTASSPSRARIMKWIDMISDDSVEQLEHIIEAMGHFSRESLDKINQELG